MKKVPMTKAPMMTSITTKVLMMKDIMKNTDIAMDM